MTNRSSSSLTSAPSTNNRFSRTPTTRTRRSTLFWASIRPVKFVAGLISAAETLTTVTAGGGAEAGGLGCLLSLHPATSKRALNADTRGRASNRRSIVPPTIEDNLSVAPTHNHYSKAHNFKYIKDEIGEGRIRARAQRVPRMLRSAISACTRVFDALCLAAWCAADPGPKSNQAWVPALRSSVTG